MVRLPHTERTANFRRRAAPVGVCTSLQNAAIIAIACLVLSTTAYAQSGPSVHYRHNALTTPPGAIGRQRLEWTGPVPGYFQPIQIQGPEGLLVSPAVDAQFDPPSPAPYKVGLLIAPVYRFKVTGIPLREGAEVYPTIEVIDRTYPPPGHEWRFPVPIELTQDELYMALDGKLVTRVIYVEDPLAAMPVKDKPNDQRWFDAGAGNDPLEVADALGRPVAILRMGGRLPDSNGLDKSFYGTGAPILRLLKQGAGPTVVGAPTPAGFPMPLPTTVAQPAGEQPTNPFGGPMLAPAPAPEVIDDRSGVTRLPQIPDPLLR